MESETNQRTYSGSVAHNLCEVLNNTLGNVLPKVINQVIDEGNDSHSGVVKVGDRLFLMVQELMRVKIKTNKFPQGLGKRWLRKPCKSVNFSEA